MWQGVTPADDACQMPRRSDLIAADERALIAGLLFHRTMNTAASGRGVSAGRESITSF